MDPKSTGFSGARDQKTMPRLDEHLVAEGTREEVLRGQRIIAVPARAPHADLHARLNYVILAAAASGYVTSSDLLTRAGSGSEFATDTSVRREGIDPTTQTRYLEEVAFEVVSTQSLREITERAEELSNRGVRRVIAVFVESVDVAEWSVSARAWIPLSLDSTLDDPTLVRPVLIRALFDAEAADNEVVDSLAVKGNLAQREAAKREQEFEQGLAQGLREGIPAICEVLGIAMAPAEMKRLQTLDAVGVKSLITVLKVHRRWPREASGS